jgi:hypothetical protein
MFNLREFEQQKQAIMNNEDWKDSGKQKALAKLESQARKDARSMVHALRKDAIMQALKLREEQTKRIETTKEELAKVDYNRLMYEAIGVGSKIKASKNLTDVQLIWENAKNSNDGYVLKAWKDTSQGLIAEKFDGPDYVDLQGTLFDDIQETEAEIVKVETTKEELEAIQKLREIQAKAEEVNNAFGHGQAVISRVFDGIGFEDGNVKLGFDYEVHKLTDVKETPREVAMRLEIEREKAMEEYQNELKTKGFGSVDGDFDDLKGML